MIKEITQLNCLDVSVIKSIKYYFISFDIQSLVLNEQIENFLQTSRQDNRFLPMV